MINRNFEMKLNEAGEFTSTFSPVTRDVMSWRDEIINAAKVIGETSTKPLYLCMSGGIDSEVAAMALLEAGVPFKALTLRHMQYTNDHEVAFAIDWCSKHKIELNFLPIDITDFFVRKIDSYIQNGYFGGVKTYSIYTYMYMMEAIHASGGSAVFGMGEPLFRNHDGKMDMEFIPYRYTLIEYLRKNPEQQHFPWFFLQTPELLASYLQEPLVKLILEDPGYYNSPIPLWMQSLEKSIIYQRYFPELIRRPKGTGWEKFRNTLPILNNWINKRQSEHPDSVFDKHFYIPINEVKRQLDIN